MIKRIYYYFKLKELLKMKDLLPFVNYVLRTKGTTLFKMCMRDAIRFWFDNIIPDGGLLKRAQQYAEYNHIIAQSITKRFHQARDFWMKRKHF